MAGRANKATVERAIEGPDFEGALKIINSRISDAKEAQSAASGRASQAWTDIEKLGVHKRGAQMFAKVQAMTDEADQQDMLRTFFKLCKLEGIELETDLVDMAQRAAAQSPAPAPTPAPVENEKPAGKAPSAPVNMASGSLDAKPEPKAARKLSIVTGGADAKAAAKQHLSGNKPAPDAMD